MNDKVKQLPGTEPVPKFTDLVRQMAEELPAQLEFMAMRATMCRHAYKSLVASGFSAKEALELCTKLW